MWPPSGGRKNGDVTDGTSNTIHVVEIVGLNINWLEPRDLEFATMDFRLNAPGGNSNGSRHPGGAMSWMVDWDRRFIRDSTPPDVVRALLTVAGGEKASPR
jgi:hypothetical protein